MSKYFERVKKTQGGKHLPINFGQGGTQRQNIAHGIVMSTKNGAFASNNN